MAETACKRGGGGAPFSPAPRSPRFALLQEGTQYFWDLCVSAPTHPTHPTHPPTHGHCGVHKYFQS